MIEHSIQDLGTLVHLFMRGNHPDMAQIYLNEMQARVTAAKAEPLLHSPVTPAKKTLLEVAQGTESEPVVNNIVPAQAMNDDVRLDLSDYPEPEPEHSGPLRDDQGNVTRISVLVEERGYDPDAHDNKALKIFCDDVHIVTAHTADTVEGLVRYYKKNEQGRIKTLEIRGKVEITGI